MKIVGVTVVGTKMVKLLENLKAVDTGLRRPIDEPFHKITWKAEPVDYSITKFAREYAVTVTLGANQWIAEDAIKESRGEVINHAIQHMKYVIAEELYGELRRDLMDLHMEMRNELNYYDSPSLKKLVKIVEKISL